MLVIKGASNFFSIMLKLQGITLGEHFHTHLCLCLSDKFLEVLDQRDCVFLMFSIYCQVVL